jgi:long-chain acyl-CoA synthetase
MQSPWDSLQPLLDGLAARESRIAIWMLRREALEQWTYRQLGQSVQQLAVGLIARGIRRAEPVALFAGNRPEWIVACLAVLRAGATVVPIDVQLSRRALQHVLADSEARWVFTTAADWKRLESQPGLNPILLESLAGEPPISGELPVLSANDTAALFYTSGTTGLPKGVPLTHGNLAFAVKAFVELRLLNADDHVLLPLPLHHVYPFVGGMLAPLAYGAQLVMPRALTGPDILRALREGRVTTIIGVPRLYRALEAGIQARVESLGQFSTKLFEAVLALSTWLRRRCRLRLGKWLLRSLHRQLGPNLRLLASGGSALDEKLAWKLEALGWRVTIGYGLTETAPLLTLLRPGANAFDNVGPPIPGVELRVEDEVLARGPNVFHGYRNLPDETARVFRDGWFRTGDLGYFDSAGHLHLTGRVSTLIVTEGGKNIQPEELEELYQEHPAIREIGIFERDRQLVALIVPKLTEIGAAHEAQIEAAVRAAVLERSRQLPSYQRITDFALTRDPLPRTRLGKIQRPALVERYELARQRKPAAATGPMHWEEMSEEDRALLEHPAARAVWEWLARRYPDRRLAPDTSPQLDLGIDSLAWLNLTLEIRQQAGVELSEETISQIDTVRDLLQEVVRAAEAGLDAKPELTDEQKRWLEPPGPVRAVLAAGLRALNRVLMRGLFRLEVTGLEHLPAGQFILTPNHASYLDPFVIAAALPAERLRQTYWAGWTGAAFANPLNRFVSRLGQAVPIDPQRAVISSLAFCAAVLQRGGNLVWFPEGERSRDGRLQPFKAGIGVLTERCDVPVVPVYIAGTHEALPVGGRWPRLTRVRVTFGKPLKVRGPGAADELYRAVSALAETSPSRKHSRS